LVELVSAVPNITSVDIEVKNGICPGEC